NDDAKSGKRRLRTVVTGTSSGSAPHGPRRFTGPMSSTSANVAAARASRWARITALDDRSWPRTVTFIAASRQAAPGFFEQPRHVGHVVGPQRDQAVGDPYQAGGDVEREPGGDAPGVRGHHAVERDPVAVATLAHPPGPAPRTEVGDVARRVGQLQAVEVDERGRGRADEDIAGGEV